MYALEFIFESFTVSFRCFLMSKIVGQPLVNRFAPQKAAEWKAKVDENKDDLFNYILFLRITPFLPNWFINLTGPLVGVPLSPFFWGSVVGKTSV